MKGYTYIIAKYTHIQNTSGKNELYENFIAQTVIIAAQCIEP